MNSIELKKEKLQEFLEFLCQKHNTSVDLVFEIESACYRFEEKIIHIPIEDLRTESLKELLWTLAHEFRHHLQFEGKVNPEIFKYFQEKLEKITQCKEASRIRINPLFFIPTISIILFSNYVPLSFFIIPFSLVSVYYFFNNKHGVEFNIWLNLSSNREFERLIEKDADDFANKEVGTGHLVWGKYKDQVEFKVRQTQHPTHEERYLESLKFSENPQILNFLT